jgi:hypothetical protein
MIREIRKIAKKKGFVIYDEPYKLNIWGFRSETNVPNSFDDELHVFTNVGTSKLKKWAYWVFKCTTDPGTYWLKNPMNPQGTAILNAGQYPNSHSIGMHRGKYLALVQRGKLTVTRDYNRDAVLDFSSGRVVSGIFGVNIHRSQKVGSARFVDNHSAGCQVFKNASDFYLFMKLCHLHKAKHSNKFTYTLVDKRAENRTNTKNIVVSVSLLALAFGGWVMYTQNQSKKTAK